MSIKFLFIEGNTYLTVESRLLDSGLYPTKKKRNSKIFPLSFPFNAKMLIVIKYYVLIKSRQNSSVA